MIAFILKITPDFSFHPISGKGAQWTLGIVNKKTIYWTYDLLLFVYDSGLNYTTVQKGKKNKTKECWFEYLRVSIICHDFLSSTLL